MTRLECQPRESGMLNPNDQLVAQELFDACTANRGKVSLISDGGEVVYASIIRKGEHSSSMEAQKGGITLKLRKGRRFWHDDGSRGYVDISGETSKVELDPWHPTSKERDRVLRQIHDVFVKPRPQ